MSTSSLAAPVAAAPAPPRFLDVPTLLQSSSPLPRAPWLWYGVVTVASLVLLAALGTNQDAVAKQTLDVLALLTLGGLMMASVMATRRAAARHRSAAGAVEAVEELMQLRRWEQAGLVLQHLLSRPTPSSRVRAKALALLTMLLARHGRFADAIATANEILEPETAAGAFHPAMLDEAEAYGVRLTRLLSLLREDQLVDANAAMSDLRRRSGGAAGAADAGALTLAEIYRDIKTGHPQEAIDLLSEREPAMRRQLGHRVADAHALIARAHDMLGNTAAAAAAYRRATLLSPAAELHRRYPEVAALSGRYQPAPAPPEAL